jgi:hypothetical protein
MQTIMFFLGILLHHVLKTNYAVTRFDFFTSYSAHLYFNNLQEDSQITTQGITYLTWCPDTYWHLYAFVREHPFNKYIARNFLKVIS